MAGLRGQGNGKSESGRLAVLPASAMPFWSGAGMNMFGSTKGELSHFVNEFSVPMS